MEMILKQLRRLFGYMLFALPLSVSANSLAPTAINDRPNIDPNWISKQTTISRAMIYSGGFTSPDLVLRAYESSGFYALWLNRIDDSAWLRDLRVALGSLRYDALPEWRYNVSEINRLSATGNTLDLLDLYITDALITAISDLKGQNIHNARKSSPQKESKTVDDILSILVNLQKGKTASSVLNEFRPTQAAYVNLRETYRKIYNTEVQIIIPSTRNLAIGTRGIEVDLLKKRLEAEALLDPVTMTFNPPFFDRVVEVAVKTYQQSHGLRVDGIVGPLTRSALNRGAKDIRKIVALNIQRMREFHWNN